MGDKCENKSCVAESDSGTDTQRKTEMPEMRTEKPMHMEAERRQLASMDLLQNSTPFM